MLLDKSVLLATLSILTVSNAEPINVTSPADVEARLGEEAVLVCRTSIDLKFCSFKSPGGKLFTIDPALQYKRITYHGDNPLRDCGLKISEVEEEDNGVWKCEITLVSEDGFAVQEVREAQVMVLRTPQSIEVEVDGEKVDTLVYEFSEVGEMMVTCIAKGGRPVPSFTWKLGDVTIEAGATDEVVGEDEVPMVQQKVTLRALPKHNGKNLACVVNHEGYTAEQIEYGSNVKAVTLDVRFKPILSEDGSESKPGNASIKFLANPEPQEIEWQLEGLDGKTTVKKTPETWCTKQNSTLFCYETDFVESGPTADNYIARIVFNESHPLIKGKVSIANAIGEAETSFTMGVDKLLVPYTHMDTLSSDRKLVIIIVILTILSIIVIIIMCLIARHNKIICFNRQNGCSKKEAISEKETVKLTPPASSKTYRSSVRLERE